jgi:phosphotransferase system  glucose/maltose/N-acetylglucosamine-specific IIC component
MEKLMSIFITEMIIGAVALAGIIAFSRINNLLWTPSIGFLIGYALSLDPSYHFSGAFGGLTFGFLTTLIVRYWFYRKEKKTEGANND